MALLLGVDIGTSSLKVVLFDEDLRPVALARREYGTSYPGPGCAEQDPEDWWRAFRAATKEVLLASSAPPGAIAAIGVDGMSSLALPVDAAGTPLRPALIWLDRRARAQVERARVEVEARQLSINGNRCDPSCFAPKLAWIRQHEPDVDRAAASYLHCNAWLVQRLTGAFTMDVSQAGLSLLCDIRTGRYSDELVRGWGVDRRKLPEVSSCAEIAGRVTAVAAAATGLAAGTPVVAGAMDNVAATMGIGLRHDGDAYIAAGTVTNVGVLRDHPVLGGPGLLYHSGLEGRWLVNGGADYGGAGMLWFRNVLGDTDLAALGALGAASACGEHPLVFLPYMAGQRAPLWNDATAGVMLGITPSTERRHLARMFMESVALGARHVFDALCPVRPDRAALTGGITHSRAWTQLMADVTGMRLSVWDQAETSTLGAALLAGVGVGMFRSPLGALRRLPQAPELEPDPRHREYYEALYGVFSEAYASVLRPLAALDALRRARSAGNARTEAPSPQPATLERPGLQPARGGA